MAGVVYFSHGTKHLVRLLISIKSLRQHYNGPIAIITTDAGPAERIAVAFDDVQVVPITLENPTRRHAGYVAKASLWRHSPYDRTLYLDADTLVVKSLSPLFELTVEPLVFTQFADWVTTGSIYAGRIRQWLDVRCDGLNVRALSERCLREPTPGINTGVFLFDRGRAEPFLREWSRLTEAGHRCSFTDEYSAQILLSRHPHELLDDRWNASPIYTTSPIDRVAIWHFHGAKHLDKGDGRGLRGEFIWLPEFTQAWRANLAGVQSWAPAGDRVLARRLAAISAKTNRPTSA